MKKLFLFGAVIALGLASCEKPKEGCTNPEAINFDSAAEVNDGSCIYEHPEPEDSTEVCIEGDLDTMCLYGTQWSYVMNIDEFVSCESKEDEYWPEKDTGLIIMNESTLIMYDSTNDFVVLTKVSSTDHTITYVNDEGGESATWTIIKDEKEEIIMECEFEDSWDSCNSDVHLHWTLNKL